MKFAKEYQAALRENEYPQAWLESAISYKQLKKCIKDVQEELAHMGLDQDTTAQLWHCFNTSKSPQRLQYTFDIDQFQPKLVFRLDSTGISLMDASLDPKTKAFLRRLGDNNQNAQPSSVFGTQNPLEETRLAAIIQQDRLMEDDNDSKCGATDTRSEFRTFQISVQSDSAFFRLLGDEISGLNALIASEEEILKNQVVILGAEISQIVGSTHRLAKSELYTWREIFGLYIDHKIFFSTSEQEKYKRSSFLSQQQLKAFTNKLLELRLNSKLRRKNSRGVLSRFLMINWTLLNHLGFQELNVLAMTKILKKFDKKTALDARQTFTKQAVATSFTAFDLVRAIYFQISQNVLAAAPQISDGYTCPICTDIAYQPVRLPCNHLFCHRCILRLGQNKNSKTKLCPLCRIDFGSTVIDKDNIDYALKKHLEKQFPTEVKEKRKENLGIVYKEETGEDYQCRVM